jgi:hypothetical protein
MAAFDSTASMVPTPAESSRRRGRLGRHETSARVSPRLARRLASPRDPWHGALWEPVHDWPTRVPHDIGGFWRPPPGDGQEPRPIGALTGGRAT